MPAQGNNSSQNQLKFDIVLNLGASPKSWGWDEIERKIQGQFNNNKFKLKVDVDKKQLQEIERLIAKLSSLNMIKPSSFANVTKQKIIAESKAVAVAQESAKKQLILEEKLTQAKMRTAKAVQGQVSGYKSMDGMLQTLKQSAAQYVSVLGAFRLATNIRKVTAEFELQRVALQSIIRDKVEADKLFDQVTRLAVQSPFQLKELISYTKQLSAYKIETEDLFDTTKRLADISAGLAIGMDRLILAYGQVRAASVLRGCLGFGTEIMLYNGDVKEVQNVVVGDELIGDDLKPRNVLEIIRGYEKMYVVHQSLGEDYRVNANHILTLWDKESESVCDVHVQDYLRKPSRYWGVRSRIDSGEIEVYAIGIEEDRPDNYYGFVIDGNKRFLLGDGTVTHNTELRQFTEAGIPLVDELAKKFTELRGEVVSTAEVFDLISERAVPFEMVKEIFEDMTNESGMFYKMQEKQAQTLSGVYSNLRDAWDVAFNEMGTENRGILMGLGQAATLAAKNWRALDVVLTTVLSTMLVYKATQLSIFKSEQLALIQKKALAASEALLAKNKLKAAAAAKAASVATNSFSASIKLLTARLLANPWTLALTAITALGVGIYKLVTYKSPLEQMWEAIDKSLTEINATSRSSATSFETLMTSLKNATLGTKEYSDIVNEINRRYGEFLPNQLKATQSYNEIEQAVRGVTSALKEKAKQESLEAGRSKIETSFAEQTAKVYDKIEDLMKKRILGTRNPFTLKLSYDETEVANTIRSLIDEVENNIQLYTGDPRTSGNNLLVLIRNLLPTATDQDKMFLVSYLREYAALYAGVSTEMQKLESKVYGMYGDSDYQKRIKQLSDDYKKAVDTINSTKVYYDVDERGGSQQRDADLLAERVKYLKEMIKLSKDFSQYDEARQYESELQSLISAGDEWRRIVKEIIGDNQLLFKFKYKDSDTFFTYVKDLQGSYDELIRKQELIDKGGVIPGRTKDSVKRDIETVKSIADAIGYDLTKQTKGRGKTADEVLKSEISLVKKAYEEYVKLADVFGESAAAEKVKEEFGSVFDKFTYAAKKVPLTIDDVVSSMSQALANGSFLGKDDKLSISLEVGEFKLRGAKEAFQKELDKMSKDISNQKKANEFYEKILGLTGNKKIAQDAAKSIYGILSGDVGLMLRDRLQKAFDVLGTGIKITPDVDISEMQKRIESLPKEQRAVLQPLLDEYRQYSESVLELAYTNVQKFSEYENQKAVATAKAQSEIAKIMNSTNLDDSTKILSTQSIRNRLRQELAEIDFEMLKHSDIWANTFQNLAYLSTEALNETIEGLKKYSKSAAVNLDPENFKTFTSALEKLTDEAFSRKYDWTQVFGGLPEFMEKRLRLQEQVNQASELDKEAQKNLKEVTAKYAETVATLTGEQLDLNEATAEYIELLIRQKGAKDGLSQEQIEQNVQSFQDISQNFSDASSNANNTSKGLGKAMSAMKGFMSSGGNAVAIVDTIIKAVHQAIQGIKEITDYMNKNFGGDENSDWNYFVNSLSEFDQYAFSGWENLKSGNFVGAIKDTILSIASLVKNIGIGRTIHEANIAIEKQEEALKDLEYAYKDLEHAAEKALGKDWIEQNLKQQQNLLAQIRAVNIKISAESSKGKMQDDDKIREYREELQQLQYDLEDLADSIVETMAGSDLTSAATRFAESWVDAKIAMEDTSAAIQEEFDEMMRNLLVNSVFAKLVQTKLKPVFDMIEQMYAPESPGGISATADELRKLWELMQIVGGQLDTEMGDLWDQLGEWVNRLGSTETELSGLSKEVGSLTEASALALAGSINTWGYSLSIIKDDVGAIRQILSVQYGKPQENAGGDINSLIEVQNMAHRELVAINANTLRTAIASERLLSVFESVVTPRGGRSSKVVNIN